MTPDAAADLAARIRGTWPGQGPTAETWAEALTPLDQGAAGTTLMRLRNDLDKCPSIAEFRRLCLRLNTRDPNAPECDVCDGSGWAPAPDRQDGTVTRTVECDQCQPTDTAPCRACGGRRKVDRQFPHLVSQVKPCPMCDEGRARGESAVWRDRRAS